MTLPGIMTFMLREKTLPGIGNINQKISFWPVHCWLGDPGFLGQEGSCVETSRLTGRCPEHLAFRPCLARVTLEAVTCPGGHFRPPVASAVPGGVTKLSGFVHLCASKPHQTQTGVCSRESKGLFKEMAPNLEAWLSWCELS